MLLSSVTATKYRRCLSSIHPLEAWESNLQSLCHRRWQYPGLRRIPMTQHNHQTAATQFVEARGIRFAYRRFGKAGGVPLVFNMHFTGTMDHWDPAVTDGFAKDREVVLFDNAGISNSSGEVPASIEAFAKWAAPRENPYDYPKALRQPTLVVNGSADVIIYTVNSFILQ